MLKALLKKQFLELNTFYFQNKKTGKNRSKGGIIGMIVLFVLLFASIGFAFYGMDSLLCASFLPFNMDWMYFAMTGVLAIFLGVFGGVFNTYAGLYHAKDNELLLSMPIPPSKILLVRMVGVYAMGLLYESLVSVPAIIAYWVHAKVTAVTVIVPILLVFIVGFFVLALICALGWVVALISSKLKNKSFITVLVTVAFLGIYYFVYFKISTILQYIASNAAEIGDKAQEIYPLYIFGLAWVGKALPLLAVTAVVFVLAAVTYYILSKTFIKIVTTKTAEKKTEYKAQAVKSTSVSNALLHKELKRFVSSPTYLMNCGLGIVLTPILGIVALIKSAWIKETVAAVFEESPEMAVILPVVVAAVIGLMLSLNQITAPSISLEGKNIWILQSMPVNAIEVLNAKQRLHLIMNVPSAVISSVLLGIAFGFGSDNIIAMAGFAVAFAMFMSSSGLCLNLKKPNLTWTNETVPVKQSASIMIALFGDWFICLLFGGIGFFTMSIIDPIYFMIGSAFVLAGISVLLNRWLKNKGTVIFKNL